MARILSLTLLAALPALPQGAVPNGISAWQPIEVSDAHWITKPSGGEKPVYRKGNLTLDGRRELTFATTDGEELRIPYASITDLQFGEVAPPPKPAKSPPAKSPPAKSPKAVESTSALQTEGAVTGGKKRGYRAPKLRMPKMPSISLAPHLPSGPLRLLTITHRRGSGVEQTFFRFDKENAVFLMNAISIKSNVAIRRVGYRDPWNQRPAPAAIIAAGGAGGS